MSTLGSPRGLSRRDAIAMGLAASGGFVGALVGGCSSPGSVRGDSLSSTIGGPGSQTAALVPSLGKGGATAASFPAGLQDTIEDIIQAQGSMMNGVFQIEVDRNDIQGVTLRGVHIKPAFEINGTLNFQSLGGTKVIMNSDLCLKEGEIDRFIDQLLSHDIAFQAEHQHFYDFDPLVWFIHFRAIGDAATIARGVKAALNVTTTPFPQTLPKHPTTPLPAEQLGDILGAKPTIGADGIVSFQVPRRNEIVLAGVDVNPYLNIPTPIAFQPYGGGINAAAVPDFGMVATEIPKVMSYTRERGWDIGCLYNQETDEMPQLFFSHQFKVGNSLQLAREIRGALNLMDMVFMTP